MTSSPPWTSWILLASLSLACSTNTATTAEASADPVQMPDPPQSEPEPEPEPETEPEPEPEPVPKPDEGRVCGARAGDTCGDDEYCAYEPAGMCGWADATAVCKKKPQACTLHYDPVCGCDQKKYANACAAAAAGTGVLKKGECKDLPGER